MRQPLVNDLVVLLRDVPEKSLQRGKVGVVRSTWFAPTEAYEVEFPATGLEANTRALLMAEQLQVEERHGRAEIPS